MINLSLYDIIFLNKFRPETRYLLTWTDEDGIHENIDFHSYLTARPENADRLYSVSVDGLMAVDKDVWSIQLDKVVMRK